MDVESGVRTGAIVDCCPGEGGCVPTTEREIATLYTLGLELLSDSDRPGLDQDQRARPSERIRRIDRLIQDARDHLLECHEGEHSHSHSPPLLSRAGLEAATSATTVQLDELPIMMWLAGADGYRTHVSTAWREVTGQSMAGATGDDWSTAVHPDDVEARLELERTALKASRGYSSTYRLRARDGRYLRIAEVASPRFDGVGRLTGWVGICSPMGYELSEREVPQVENVWSLWIHELRSPLQGIMGMADILVRRDGEFSREERMELEAQLLSDARRLDGIVRNVRVVAEAAEWHGKLESTQVKPLVEEAIDWHRRRHPESQVALRLDGDLCPVRVDATAVVQILNNLLDNAVKYAGGRGLEVVCHDDGRAVAISVLDRGPGIPAEARTAIFDWGYRAPPSEAGDVSGSGFGLALSRRLARLMDGDLTARNRPDGGAEFRLTLPWTSVPCEKVT